MSPGVILAWVPVARELVGLGQLIADRVRARRAKRRARNSKVKAKPC